MTLAATQDRARHEGGGIAPSLGGGAGAIRDAGITGPRGNKL